MATASKAELEAQVKRLQKSLDREKVKNAALGKSLREAGEREKATAAILRTIGRSPNDAQPVFDGIANAALRLIGGVSAAVTRVVGDTLHLAAFTSTSKAGDKRLASQFPCPVSKLPGHARAIRSRAPYCINDTEKVADGVNEVARARGYRSAIFVPLLRNKATIGTIGVSRRDPGAFSDHEVELLKTFAAQAVIAIENARLFNETREALEQQTATAEILRVISSSPTDTQPVFDAIAESAARLCSARDSVIRIVDGDTARIAAHFGSIPHADRSAAGLPILRGSFSGRAILERRTIHIADTRDEQVEVDYQETIRRRPGDRFRTALIVPLLREDTAIGTIDIRRQEAQPFSDKQIELLQTFAAQAVIAIENVRLFKELQARNAELTESLDQQTATSEILRAISSSPTDTQPVFDAIVRSGARLFKGLDMYLRLVKDGQTDVVANTEATNDGSSWPTPLGDESRPSTRAILRRQIVHIPDVFAEDWINEETKARAVRRANRGLLHVPMLRENTAVGVISLSRPSAGPFTDKQIALLQTFADQAVIAIENVRLFKELQARNAEITEALEQQTATADILRVISSSPTDLQPVFDAILENATRLCDANLGTLGLYDGEKYEYVAQRGGTPEFVERLFARGPFAPIEGTNAWRMINEKRPVHVRDLPNNAQVRSPIRLFMDQGARTILAVPMLKDGRVVGGINIFRPEVRPFSQEQIDLVSTFANQAVIAIENVRLFKELQAQTEALSRSVKQLTALGEVGQAISSSLELETVLKTIVSRAIMLTGLDAGSIYEYDQQAQVFRLQATENVDEAIIEAVRSSPIRTGDGVVGHIGVTREVTQIPDILDASYQSGRRELLVRAGYNSGSVCLDKKCGVVKW